MKLRVFNNQGERARLSHASTLYYTCTIKASFTVGWPDALGNSGGGKVMAFSNRLSVFR